MTEGQGYNHGSVESRERSEGEDDGRREAKAPFTRLNLVQHCC